MSIESVMPSSHLILCRPCLVTPSIFPSSGSFQMSLFFASGGQSTGVSASALVLPMNIQDWFPLGLTSWICLKSKQLLRVFYQQTSKCFKNTHLKEHSSDFNYPVGLCQRSPGEVNSYPLQYSCLENSMSRGAWQATGHEVANSQTWLSDFHFFFTLSNLTTFPYMHWNSRKYLSKCPPHTFLDKLMFFFLL